MQQLANDRQLTNCALHYRTVQAVVGNHSSPVRVLTLKNKQTNTVVGLE
jgi:hypothetical protein